MLPSVKWHRGFCAIIATAAPSPNLQVPHLRAVSLCCRLCGLLPGEAGCWLPRAARFAAVVALAERRFACWAGQAACGKCTINRKAAPLSVWVGLHCLPAGLGP